MALRVYLAVVLGLVAVVMANDTHETGLAPQHRDSQNATLTAALP
jgi:hypothetical protein